MRETFIARCEHHTTVDSTSNLAKQYAADRPGDLPLLIVADHQTAGRGRASKRWWTGPGALAFSLLLDLRAWGTNSVASPLVSLATGLAVVRTVVPLIAGEPVGIHWPNDVFVAGRKLSGILVEVVPEGLCVVGIGLNTNNTIHDAPEDMRHRVATLRDLSGRVYDHTEILVALLGHFDALLRQLAAAPASIAAETDRLCLQRGQTLTLPWGRQTVTGLCLGVAPDGGLILDTPEGKRTFYSGAPEGR
jgi:BirA family transcriptional regulator, biotin operon repressor / biotin---[acetyl-CoA-carboxylase] ligase